MTKKVERIGFLAMLGAMCFGAAHAATGQDAAREQPPAECEPGWSAAAGNPGLDGWVYTMHVWDDGNGPALYAGGRFNLAGGRVAKSVAKWDGYHWRPLGEGITGQVMALASFNDGTGDALYVGGVFHAADGKPAANIARWDPVERTWSTLGPGLTSDGNILASVIALEVFDDGTGPALYAGGTFTRAGDRHLGHIAKWDGHEWSSVGGGVDNAVRAFVVFDDGSGRALYAGGLFGRAGTANASRLARWDGNAWRGVSGEFRGQGIRNMTVHNDGRGPALYVCGVFQAIDDIECNNVARWDPAADTWSNLSTGANERVVDIYAFDDGEGERLYAAGWFTRMGETAVNYIAKWDGRTWSPLAGSDLGWLGRAMAKFPDARTGRYALHVGGGFPTVAGKPAKHAAAWVGCGEAPPLTPSKEPLGREPSDEDLRSPDRGAARGGRGQPAQREPAGRGRPPGRGGR